MNNNIEYISKIKKGEEASFRHFVNSYSKDLFYYAQCFVRTKETAEEVVSDVFLDVWRHWEEIDGIKNIKAWLLTLTHNKAVSYLRKVENSAYISSWEEMDDFQITGNLQTPDEEIISREEIAQINRLIQTLPPKCKNDEERHDLNKIAQSLQTEIPQDIKEVTLVVSDQKKIELDNNAQVTYSATGQVQVNSNKLTEDDGKEAYNQIIVPKGKRSQIVLADNSKIWINSGSKVIYPRTFEGKYREIYVEGEVYLKVAHDTSKPFIVNTSGFEVSVLGTSFNISAYKNQEKATVVLVEGSVNVKDQQNRHIKMVPNEKVELNQAGITGKAKVDARDYISWIDGTWTLQGESLKQVLQRLQDYYGQNIRCDTLVENEQMFGKLYLNDDLNQVIKSILSILPTEYTIKNNVIYIE